MTALPAIPPAPERPGLAYLARAIASMPSDTVLSHRSAAALWGLWTPGFDGIEITSPAGPQGSRRTTSVQRRAVVAHRRLLAADDIVEQFGLPVTSVERTWLDLATLLDIHDLVAAGDSAVRAGLSPIRLAERVRSLRGSRGCVRTRVAAGLLDGRSRSRPESRIRAALVLSGLPCPRVNEAVLDAHGGWLAEPDLHYLEAKLALEYNGADHATVTQMRKDSTRLLDLQREGWRVRTHTATHAFNRLDEVVDDVRRLLRELAPHLLTAPHLSPRVTGPAAERRRNRRL